MLHYYSEVFMTTIWLTSKSEDNKERSIIKIKDDDIRFWDGAEIEIPIDDDIFNKMYEVLLNIDIKNMLHGNQYKDDTNDGVYIDLSFGGTFNKIHFEMRKVNKRNIEKRNIKDLCGVAKEIFEIVGIDKSEYENEL